MIIIFDFENFAMDSWNLKIWSTTNGKQAVYAFR